MNQVVKFFLPGITLIVISCKKNDKPENSIQPIDNYSSLNDFYSKNGVRSDTFYVNPMSGGTYVTKKGTTLFIPANAFVSQTGNLITGEVTIELRDLYSTSDFVLSGLEATSGSKLMKSAGEFFIRAIQDNKAVLLDSGKTLTIKQPLLASEADTGMEAFLGSKNTSANGHWWKSTLSDLDVDSLLSISQYIFTLYQFSSPADSGTWCNSDNPTYFSAYPLTSNTYYLSGIDSNAATDLFMVFSNLTSMVHVYPYYGKTGYFVNLYAPTGLNCTIVAIAVLNGKVFSSFTPIMIQANQTVEIPMSETTTEQFLAALHALN